MVTFGTTGIRSLFDDEKDAKVPSQPTPTAVVTTTIQPRPHRWVIYVSLGIGIGVAATVGGWRFTRKPVQVVDNTPKAPTYDQAWERKMRADIAALDSEVKAAKEAYMRQETFSKSRTFSREDDRKEAARLNQSVLDLEKARASLEAELDAHRKE